MTPHDHNKALVSMGEKVPKQVEISPALERKRAKYTVEDVRQLCGGISRSTVMREIRRKRLACYRARRTLRFSEEHVTTYLERVEQGRTGKQCTGKSGLEDGATTGHRRK
jgi:excisionase family DNA binding protein